MRNAKREFAEHVVEVGRDVKCAKLCFGGCPSQISEEKSHTLKCGYSTSDLESFMSEINKEYDAGYGGQELFGTIWYTDGTWSSRGEYDGSEWWEHNECPEIDSCLE